MHPYPIGRTNAAILCTSALILCTLPGALHGQRTPASPTRYRPQPRVLLYESVNPYHMYWVHGSDTTGQPWRTRSVARQSWRAAGQELQVLVRRRTFDVEGVERTDTFLLSPPGRMRLANGKAPGLNTQVDLVPFLPTIPLARGAKWTDTLSAQATGPAGEHRFDLIRTYVVGRMSDSAGMRIAEVTGSGTVHYREGWWSDSTTGGYVWVDVTGPIEESFRLDLSGGRMLDRRWKMDLVGQGGRPVEGRGTDTVPAGLRSSSVDQLIDSTRLAEIDPLLPGADTSWTVNEGAVLRHTVARGWDFVASSMTRNDGLVGVARTRFQDRRPILYTATWIDSIGGITRDTIQVDPQGLRLRAESGTDTLIVPPAGVWGIADYAMQEHLVPVLLSLDEDSKDAPFAIYRPVARHWDIGTVTFVHRGEMVIITIRMGKEGTPQYLLLTEAGDLLYGENSDPTGAQRVPTAGSTRRAKLEQFLADLRRG